MALAWLVVWLPLIGFLFNALSGLIIKDKAAQKRLVSFVAPGVVLGAFAVALLIVLPAMMAAPEHRAYGALLPFTSPTSPWMSFGGFRVNFGMLVDPLSMLMTLIVTGVGGLIHIYATGYMADDAEQPRFFTYFNLFIFMMLVLVLGENFLLMFVGWEGVGSCSYLLISFWYTDVNNAKAGNKAFIVNRVGDLGFALGIMAVWSVFGTLSFFTEQGNGVMQLAAGGVAGKIAPAISANGLPVTTEMLTLICCLLFVGAMGKSAQIPLWTWLPDAMAGPTPVSALIHAATMVTAGVVMLTRCSWLFVQAPDALKLVGIIGILTAFMGATIGLVQNDIKRVLAFSTVSQLGYMFLACGVGNFAAGMFHVTTHAFFKALLFLGSGAVIHSMLGEQDMRKMGGLKKLIPRTYLVMLIGTIAIAGIPPLSGFFSKDEILASAQRSPWGSGSILYVVGLLTAFMTAFYMMRLISKTFLTDARFVDGELVAHHHSNEDDAHDAHDVADIHGKHETHDDLSNPGGEQSGHEEAGHAANTAHDAGDAHGHGHGNGKVHESPPSMMIPLYILAVFSALFGLVGFRNHSFEHFLEPSIAPASLYALKPGEEMFPEWMGFVISTIVAVIGVGLAYSLYRTHQRTGDLIPAERKVAYERNPANPYTFLLNKWWWDALYNAIFINLGGKFADRILWRTVDAGLIDGTVKGAAGLVGLLSNGFRRLQTGYVRNYALGMLFGVVLLVAGLLYSWNHLVQR